MHQILFQFPFFPDPPLGALPPDFRGGEGRQRREGWKGKGRGGKGERKERGGEGKGKEEEGRGGEVCVIAVAEIDAPGIKTNYLRSDWVLNTDDGDARKICDDAGFVVPVRFFTARHLHLIRLRLLYTHHGPCKSDGRIQIAIRFKSRSKHLPMIRSDYSRRFELNWTPGRVQFYLDFI